MERHSRRLVQGLHHLHGEARESAAVLLIRCSQLACCAGLILACWVFGGLSRCAFVPDEPFVTDGLSKELQRVASAGLSWWGSRVDPENKVLSQSSFMGLLSRLPMNWSISGLQGKRRGFHRFSRADGVRARAKPGHYRLRSTGEVVVDPDFTTSLTVRAPASLAEANFAVKCRLRDDR